MRTSVAPSSTATSKSPDMPMDSSRIVTPGSRRDGHQSQHMDPLEGPHALDQAHQLIRTESMLGFFTRHVHFKKNRLREPVLPGHSIEALGHLQPIHGMQQREASDRRLDLVRLERPDQMPVNLIGGPYAQHFYLRQGLLDAVLAEHPAPAGRRL